MTTLLRAPAGGGKTEHVLARLRAIRAAEPLAPIVILLPNQFQREAFRRRLLAGGGALNVTAQTFQALSVELLARARRLIPLLDEAAQVRVVRVLVTQLAAAGALTYFAPLRERPGLAVALREVIQELKRNRLFPDQFAAAARGLGPRLEEIGLIYTTYQAWLQSHAWADAEGQGWLAAEALEQDAGLGRDLRLLAVDGFDEFNPTQLAVLAHLAGRAQETLITLTGGPGGERLAYRRFRRAEQRLRAFIGAMEVVDLPAPAARGPVLERLEPRLFEPGAAPDTPPVPKRRAGPVITFTAAQDREMEARAALRWVKQRLVLDGLAPADLVILARDLEPYRAPLTTAAREFGLPLRVAAGLPLAENPLVDALLNLLALPAPSVNWRPRALSSALRSPYFNWDQLGITLEHAATLEAVARLGLVVAGQDQWRQAFDRLSGPAAEALIDEPEAEAERPGPEAVAQAREAFGRLAARLAPPADAADLAGLIAFVEDLIGEAGPAALELHAMHAARPHNAPPALEVFARAQMEPELAARDLQALAAFKEALRGLARAEAVLEAPRAWEYSAFLMAVREAVEAETYHPPDPPQAVLAASVLDARGLAFRGAALLGLAEGEFPRAERELPLLRETEREALRDRGLDLEPRLRGEEVTLFYEAVTRAGERLWLSRPYLADDGQPWEASAYWRQVQRLLGDPPEVRVRAEDRLPPEQAASAEEWVTHGYAPEQTARGLDVLRAREAAAAAGPHEGDLAGVGAALARRFGQEHVWSASRLEAYGTCGFYFLTAYGLKLEPRLEPEAGFDVRALGRMLHAILEKLYGQAADPADLPSLLDRLPAVARAVFATAPEAYGFRPTALWAQQQAELERQLAETVTALAEASAGWTPRWFEQAFGGDQPALTVETSAGVVRLRGYIDRVDVDAAGRLRVVDYKAGNTPIMAEDLRAGRRLQLPLYALAAQEALQLGQAADGLYWHINSARAASLRLAKFEGGLAEACAAARRHLGAHVRAIRAGQFQPKPPPGGCPAYCPAAAFCWRYAPYQR